MLSKPEDYLSKESDVLKFKRTRLFKYVPLQCVTVIVGPFGDDFAFLKSSEGFHHADKIYVVYFEKVSAYKACVVGRLVGWDLINGIFGTIRLKRMRLK